ncbi:VOC family protein [Lysobacter capsici]|uniref:VOC family protein n=1 Tax=Lysobacter capsici TaxID=435897 RepID=UPI00287B6755|nr:VOC family protein [Lysobacter capsici]WND78554.1 VOC family protein [Lysobacter capsici]WND83749.1 VOC family protein [Lysobacter capsici]
MFDHMGFAVSDLQRSHDFYLHALAPLGYGRVMSIGKEQTGGYEGHAFGPAGQPAFWIGTGEATSRGLHVALRAQSAEQVEAFHAAALAAGGRDNGAPGPREHYAPGYFGAFVFDPDGNNVEAVYRGPAA